jgi:hypothetical protein
MGAVAAASETTHLYLPALHLIDTSTFRRTNLPPGLVHATVGDEASKIRDLFGADSLSKFQGPGVQFP